METKSKILVVDDEKDIIELIEDIIETHDHMESVSCTSGHEALKKLEKESFDLVLTDFRMPHMNGGQLVEAIRNSNSINKDIAILFITANPEQTKEFVESYEDILILPKPITIEKLAKLIIQAMLKA